MSSLQRLFHSNIRTSPSRSVKPKTEFKSRRAALNRAAHALSEVRKARENHAQLRINLQKKIINIAQNSRIIQQKTRNIARLEEEYYKLARRAALIKNANMKSGPLTARELALLRLSANIVKNMSVAVRTLRRTSLPMNLQHKIIRSVPLTYAT